MYLQIDELLTIPPPQNGDNSVARMIHLDYHVQPNCFVKVELTGLSQNHNSYLMKRSNNPGCPGTRFVNQAGLKLTEILLPLPSK